MIEIFKLLLGWFAAVVAVEAITEVVVQSDLFIKLRNVLFKISPGFLGKLLSCGYCFSVWVSIIGWFMPGTITNIYILDGILRVFLLHRLSNVIHEFFMRWEKRLPLVIVFNKVNEEFQLNEGIEVDE
jgi:hypothetical protein